MRLLRPLVEAAGADYRQWWALTRVMLKADTRSSSFMGQRGPSDPDAQKKALRGMAIMYGIMGIFLAPVAWAVPDAFLSATIVYTGILFLVGTTILIEFQSVVVDPTDHDILAFRPVSSRTYFLVKLTNVIVYVCALATLLGLASTIALGLRHGWAVGLAAGVGLYGVTIFTALALVAAYAAVLHVVRPERLERALSYVQLAVSTAFYGVMILGQDFAEAAGIASLSLEPSLLTLLHPATWFAGLPALAAGRAGSVAWVGVGLGAAALVALFLLSTRTLSLSYAERLSAMDATTDAGEPGAREPEEGVAGRGGGAVRGGVGRGGVRRASTRLRRWMPPEMRVVATLIRAQFRHDMKFRMSVLGILPLTVLYLYMSIEDGVLPDPFVDATLGTLGDLTLLHMAVLLMPVLLMTSITYSESAGAAWVFFTTPARAPRLVRHSKNVLLLFFVLPYLVLVGALLAWFFEAWWHAAIHVVVLGLVTNLGLQFAVLATPRIPFSQPVQKARQGGRVLPMFFGVGVVLVLLTLLMAVAYGSWAGIAGAVAGLGLINLLLEVAVSNKVARRMEGLEFAA